jgi:hypothetical protein
MTMKDWVNQLLDLTIVFSFDHSGFQRHCPHQLQKVDLSGRHSLTITQDGFEQMFASQVKRKQIGTSE